MSPAGTAELPYSASVLRSPLWVRTRNLPINSRMLCRLSYQGLAAVLAVSNSLASMLYPVYPGSFGRQRSDKGAPSGTRTRDLPIKSRQLCH